jgi:hypothetical protein
MTYVIQHNNPYSEIAFYLPWARKMHIYERKIILRYIFHVGIIDLKASWYKWANFTCSYIL